MKTYYIIYMTLLSLFLVECTKKESKGTEDVKGQEVTFYADMDSETKTLLHNGYIWWSPYDKILVGGSEGTGGTYVFSWYGVLNSSASEPCPTTEFSGTFPALAKKPFIALYPAHKWKDYHYVSFDVSDIQTSKDSTFSQDNFPAAAATETDKLQFKNMCGGFKIVVSKKGIKKIVLTPNVDTSGFAGEVRISGVSGEGGVPFYDGWHILYYKSQASSISLTVEGGGEFKPGVPYYATAVPQNVGGGMNIKYYASDSIYCFKTEKSFDIERNIFVKIHNLESDPRAEIIPIIPLSAKGTANSYVVSKAGYYKFKADVKGSSQESIGKFVADTVLWESFGTNILPAVGDIIKGTYLFDNYVVFSTPSELKDGNAVIAVKDARGNILWSWHIWVCKDFDPAATAQVYNNNAGTMMDRNLGATSATPGDVGALGLLYQWGRKDPFLGSSSISSEVRALSTGTWPSAVSSGYSTGTFYYVVQHPMQFVTGYKYNDYDWYCGYNKTDNTRWQTSASVKGIYDPCPQGWRVPDCIWSKAGFPSQLTFDQTNRGIDFAAYTSSSVCWYPAAGELDYVYGSFSYVGDHGNYWSCTPSGLWAIDLRFWGESVYSNSSTARASGLSVRCVRDSLLSSVFVTTSHAYSVTSANAICGGTVSSSLNVTARGVVWSTSHNPTLEFCTGRTSDGDGVGTFSSSITGLIKNTTYYVRAYAITPEGTVYGDEVSFVPKENKHYVDAGGVDRGEGIAINSVIWAPVNCGYDATNYRYGKLYQWGRKDGCGYDAEWTEGGSQKGPETVIQTTSTTTTPIAAKDESATIFYKINSSPNDWLTPQDSTRWNSNLEWPGKEVSPTKTNFDPCPDGWRVPTSAELTALLGSHTKGDLQDGAGVHDGMKGKWFDGSTTSEPSLGLFLPAAGCRSYHNGDAYGRGSNCDYWSSSVIGSNARVLYFDSSYAHVNNHSQRANGSSVRCVKE